MTFLFLIAAAAVSVQPPATPAGDADKGKTLFVKNGCYQCHNYEGNGGSAGARIAPNPPPFRGFVSYVRSPKGDMPPYKDKVLSEQDLADIYAYLRGRPRPPAVASIPLLARDVTPAAGERTSSAREDAPTAPVIDNDRVTVWPVTSLALRPTGDSVWISAARPGEAAFDSSASHEAAPHRDRGFVIALKNTRVTPLENKSGYLPAFPRPGQLKKLLENDRVIVWDYTWAPGVPTPMHFHDKDVVVVYVADGALKSTTPDGQSTTNEFSVGTVRFNQRDRAHTEVLANGTGRAIITELK